MNSVWGGEEFEATITKAVCALYEKRHITNKKIDKSLKVKDKEIKQLKQIGLYFPPQR